MCDDNPDKITNLPNITFSSNAYSGYLNVSDTKALHYLFFESKGDPATDPLLMWFNGGPGCSSMLGAFQENGPWVVLDNGTIFENPFPWNTKANTLYIESPAGVGYSVYDAATDNSTNDMQQSEDAL